MVISGEAFPFVKALDFESKRELLDSLEKIKKDAAALPEPDRAIVTEMADAAIDEITAAPEDTLMELKRFLDKRNPKKNK